MAERQIISCRDSTDLSERAAEEFVRLARQAIQLAGRFTVALSGGSTPKALYTLLAAPGFAQRISWNRTHLFWGDERCVPPGDPASNYRLARESLLDHVPVPSANLHRIRGEDGPAAAAAAYERELRQAFATPDGLPRGAPGSRFDLVLLGMGDNGHTASLFPGMTAVHERGRWVVVQQVAAEPMWRVTLTPVVINTAGEVVFLVSGREKAATLGRVLDGPHQPDSLPAQVVAPRSGRLRWLVDAAAAADLRRR